LAIDDRPHSKPIGHPSQFALPGSQYLGGPLCFLLPSTSSDVAINRKPIKKPGRHQWRPGKLKDRG
jgi:hypothetical protein